MAKQRQEDPPAGSPAWMSTFSDLMNLLLCFFVLLFSMSSVDSEKFDQLIASLQSSFSILPAGGTSVGEGMMISSGISQLQMFDTFFQSVTDGRDQEFEHEGQSDQQTNVNETGGIDITEEMAVQAYEEANIKESEAMAEDIEHRLIELGIQDLVDVDFNSNYVLITLNGALLFDSGSSELRGEALELVGKLASILKYYNGNVIEIEGHTDNVPITTAKYESNDVLSMYRALYVADYIREKSGIDPAHIKSAGRGEYVPIADNASAEGRARNRRVEIKVFNSFNSKDAN